MTAAATWQCKQNLGIFQSDLPKIVGALDRVAPSDRTQIGKWAVLDLEEDPKFPYQGCYKKVFYCVLAVLQSREFSVFVALRSKGDCRRFAKEKRVLTLLKGASGVLQPLCIEKQGDFEWMISELFNLGDLCHFIHERTYAVGQLDCDQIAYSVAKSLQECHSLGIIWRDLKPANILVRQLDDGSFEVKFVDFAYAHIHGESDEFDRSGTSEYMPIELGTFVQKTGRMPWATSARDIWALGAVLYELASGKCVMGTRKSDGAIMLRPDDGKKVGTFDREIKEILYGKREERPTLGDLAGRMEAVLSRTYPALQLPAPVPMPEFMPVHFESVPQTQLTRPRSAEGRIELHT